MREIPGRAQMRCGYGLCALSLCVILMYGLSLPVRARIFLHSKSTNPILPRPHDVRQARARTSDALATNTRVSNAT
jgi:hypothetical protein